MIHNHPQARGDRRSRARDVQHVCVSLRFGGLALAQRGAGIRGLCADVRVTQRMAHHIVSVVVGVLVRAVDVKDVGASLVGGAEPRLHLDVAVACCPDRVRSRLLDQLMSVANFLFDEKRQA